MVVLLCWDLGVWSYDAWGVSWCRYLVLPLLGGSSIPWLLLPSMDRRLVWWLWGPWERVLLWVSG